MLVNIFRGSGRIFGCTAAGAANLPSSLAPWSAFKTIELNREGPPVPGINAAECLDDLEKYGFHITEAHVRITERFI